MKVGIVQILLLYYSTISKIIYNQYQGQEFDLMLIWNRQGVPEQVGAILIELAELVLLKITDPSRKVANVTQWCKKIECWEDVKKFSWIFQKVFKST